MRKYKLSVFWTMGSDIEIEAESLEHAIELSLSGELPDGSYIPGSFTVDPIEDQELGEGEA